MNQFEPEDRLSKVLRNLAQESVRNAPPELGMELAGAFRRHHRVRRAKNAAIMVLATICLLSTTWLLTRSAQKLEPSQAAHDNSGGAAPHAVPTTTPKSNEIKPVEAKNTIKQGPKRRTSRPEEPQVASRETGDFLPLPSYDPSVIANNDLQIIRVEMPIQDLRLVGAPVNVNIPNRPVLADFVVGRDGTPYAVRLVR